MFIGKLINNEYLNKGICDETLITIAESLLACNNAYPDEVYEFDYDKISFKKFNLTK